MTEPRLEKPSMNERRMDLGSWGAFFIWTGIAFLAPLSWGVWLLGVSVVILGTQLYRRQIALHLEGFWLVAGCLFLIGGVWELAGLERRLAIIPIVCILAGAGLLASALRRPRFKHPGV
ncbi:MAG TPA: hypothetical protein VFT22_35760 [Kofleriaceae bacterium]|nr:hypothetical protein [Kofleriaceae bacterium]